MRIQYSNEFYRAFRKLSLSEKDAVLETIELFSENPHDPSLHNHALEKPMFGKRAISAGEDLRIIFRERWEYIEVIMLDVGSHEDVYEC